jgi:hypothetical protein
MRRLPSFLLAAGLALPSLALAQDEALPAGHPAVGAAAAAPQVPEDDAVISNPSIPPGTIQVKLVTPSGEPLANTDVVLNVQFQKIAEGEQRSERHAKTDAAGMARFPGLITGSDYVYRASASSGPAHYLSEQIQLPPDAGALALLHVYPVTHRVEEASVGGIVYVYVETRDDVFQFEVLARYGNRSRITWVPENARMSLPSGFKAFKAGESMTDVRFEEDPGHGVKLTGTFAPGEHQVSFRFQVPRHEESSAAFHFGLPPHVAEARFIAEAAPTMEIDVDGFEKPQSDVSQTGQRVLVTRRVAVRGESNGLGGFIAQLSGIPTPGNGRWIAVLIAGALAALGFAAFRGKLGDETQAELHERDAERARRVLLDEVVDLTRAKRDARIGPSTYESARRTLVDALSRILSTNPGLGTKPKRQGTGKGAKKAKKGAAA